METILRCFLHRVYPNNSMVTNFISLHPISFNCILPIIRYICQHNPSYNSLLSILFTAGQIALAGLIYGPSQRSEVVGRYKGEKGDTPAWPHHFERCRNTTKLTPLVRDPPKLTRREGIDELKSCFFFSTRNYNPIL